MKKTIILLAILALTSFAVMAQEKVERPFEINLSYGGPQAMLGFVGGAHTTFSAMAEVKYTPNKWVSIGLVGGLHDKSRSSSLGPVEEGEQVEGTSYDTNLMINVYGNWLTKKHLRLYSGVGYGTMGGYVNGDGSPSHGFQFTPVGVSFGKVLYGFAELGMGWMYCPARAGVGVRF